MSQTITDRKKINAVLTRGVENIYPSREALEKILLSGKRLRIYNGIDPTGKLHIGHGVVLKKLRQFQDLGHEIIVLIGDFTARIGDPTDKLAARKKLTKSEVAANSRGYRKLIGKILDLKKTPRVRFLHNEQWTNKLKPVDMLELASYFTVSRLLERDMFQERLKEGKEVYVHEFLYPIFQAYDSVTMDVDMEIGGSDQMFNMLAGRTLMRKLKGKGKEKFVLTTKLLTDPSGRKMGKTEGNMVNLDDPAEAMYGKLMAIPDSLILPYFELCTDTPARELTAYGLQLTAKSINPRDLKMRLAREVVTLYHSAKAATTAEAHFVNVFQKHQVPDSVEEVRVARWPATLDQLVYVSGASASASAARRLIEAGGIKIDGETVRNPKQSIPPSKSGRLLQRGKRYFRRVRLA